MIEDDLCVIVVEVGVAVVFDALVVKSELLDDVVKVVICVIAFDVILLVNVVKVDAVETALVDPWVILSNKLTNDSTLYKYRMN